MKNRYVSGNHSAINALHYLLACHQPWKLSFAANTVANPGL